MSYVDRYSEIMPRQFYSGYSSLTLDAAEEHFAMVFPIPKTGTLKKIGWRVNASTSPVLTVKVSLETVAAAVGVPVATSDAAKTLYAAGAQSAAITNPAIANRFDSITSPLQIEGLSRAAACVVTWTGHGMSGSGHNVKFADITQADWTALNGNTYAVTVINADTFSIPVNTSGYAADYVPGDDPGTIEKDGILVTAGNLVSVVIRCTAYTSGSMGVGYDQFGTMMILRSTSMNIPYNYSYLGGASAVYSGMPILTLEYTNEFIGSIWTYPVITIASIGWGSNDSPDRRGMKFKFPINTKINGAIMFIDTDEECQLILYDSNEYTVAPGFPITIAPTKRKANSAALHFIPFAEFTCAANAWYRMIVLPTTTTDITMYTNAPADDGAITGMSGMLGSTNWVYTTINGAPTSESHVWTDDITKRLSMFVIISQIDVYPQIGPFSQGSWR